MSIVTIAGYIGIGVGSTYLASITNNNKEMILSMISTILVIVGTYGVVVA